jgi:hypothetical protein
MKLTRNTEWAVIAALILYIAFTPGVQAVKTALATPVGKAVGLAVIVSVWKFVSPIIAILLTISFLRCATWNVWEMFSGAEAACTCEDSAAIWDPQSKTCKDASGNVAGPVKTCTCANGYAWDGGEKGKKECIPITSAQPPIPAVLPPLPGVEMGAGTTLGASAPTTGGTPSPSPVPETTGSAAAQTMAASPPLPPAEGGAQPGAGATSGPASV